MSTSQPVPGTHTTNDGQYTTGKATVFKTEILFDLVDALSVPGNYSMRDLIERERMHPAIVRRLDDMCRVVEV